MYSFSAYWKTLNVRQKHHLYLTYILEGHYFHVLFLQSRGLHRNDHADIDLGNSSVFKDTIYQSLETIEELVNGLNMQINLDALNRLGFGGKSWFNTCVLTILMHQALAVPELRHLFKGKTAHEPPNRYLIWFPATLTSASFEARRNGLCLHNLRTFTEALNGDDIEEMRTLILKRLSNIDPCDVDVMELWNIILAPVS